MKNPILKFFSNDKDPTQAEKNQNKNKVLIFAGIAVATGALLFLTGGGEESKPKQAGNFQLVDDDPMAKTRWVGEASQDLTLAKDKVDYLNERNQDLSTQVDDLRKIITEMKKESDANKRIYEQNLKNSGAKKEANKPAKADTPTDENLSKISTNSSLNDENLYKSFPIPENTNSANTNTANNTQEANKVGLTYLGEVPEIEAVEQIRYTHIEGSLTFTNVAKPKKEEKVVKKNTKNVIPTGSIIKAVLLSGMDAPTMAQAKTEPLPVLMKVTDLSILPNQWAYNINECFLMGEGYGDLTAERAYVRVNNISCITDKGEKIDMAMKGAATGEDGKLGLKGVVVTKQGALLARTLIAGFLQGVGESFAKQNEIVTQGWGGTITSMDSMTPQESIQAGAFQGLSKSAEKLADFYLKMADQVTPVIEISAGREINVMTTQTLELITLEAKAEQEKKRNNTNTTNEETQQ